MPDDLDSKLLPHEQPKLKDEHSEAICREIMRISNEFRKRHPLLDKFEKTITRSLGVISFVMVYATAYFYNKWFVVAVASSPSSSSTVVQDGSNITPQTLTELFNYFLFCFVGVVFWSSIAHEVEHDLIHFPGNHLVDQVIMYLTNFARPNMILGKSRKIIHLHHHQASGTESDAEELAIGSGLPQWFPRWLSCGDPLVNVALRPKFFVKLQRDFRNALFEKGLSKEELISAFRGMRVLVFSHLFLVYSLAFVNLVSFFFPNSSFSVDDYLPAAAAVSSSSAAVVPSFLWFLRAYFWFVGLPNMVRLAALIFVTSNCHFHDIPKGDLMKQTQIVNTWSPFDEKTGKFSFFRLLYIIAQLFCWRFASSHCTHHFVVRDSCIPIRLLIQSEVDVVLKKHGVVFNDFDSMWKENHFPK